MKKFISLLLVIIIVVSLVGCTNPSSQTTTTTTTTTTSNSEGGNDNPQNTGLSRGKIKDGVYTNEYVGFEFVATDAWVFYTDEELADLMMFDPEKIAPENFKESVDNTISAYDMMVIHSLTGTSVDVQYLNLSHIASEDITEEQYAETIRQSDSEVPGFNVSYADEIETVKLGGLDFIKLVSFVEIESIGTITTQICYLHKVDKYMCIVYITTSEDMLAEQIEAMFK